MERQDGEVDGRSGMPGGRERRVDRPARADAVGAGLAFDEGGGEQAA